MADQASNSLDGSRRILIPVMFGCQPLPPFSQASEPVEDRHVSCPAYAAVWK